MRKAGILFCIYMIEKGNNSNFSMVLNILTNVAAHDLNVCHAECLKNKDNIFGAITLFRLQGVSLLVYVYLW